MLSRLFSGKDKDALEQAKAAFEQACLIKGDSREAQVARIRIALRCRAVLDKTFVEGAERSLDHAERCMIALVQGEERPPDPKASAFQKIKSINGEIDAYIPLEYAEEVFKIAAAYQLEQISARQAVELAQDVADRISSHLNLDVPFEALGFMAENIEEEEAAASEAQEAAAQDQPDVGDASQAPAAQDPNTDKKSSGKASWLERAGLY